MWRNKEPSLRAGQTHPSKSCHWEPVYEPNQGCRSLGFLGFFLCDSQRWESLKMSQLKRVKDLNCLSEEPEEQVQCCSINSQSLQPAGEREQWMEAFNDGNTQEKQAKGGKIWSKKQWCDTLILSGNLSTQESQEAALIFPPPPLCTHSSDGDTDLQKCAP